MATKQRLGELLLSAGVITQEDLDKALQLQVGGNRRLGYLLIKMNIISEEQLHSALARQLGLDIVRVKEEFSPEVKKILPRHICRKYNAIPLSTGEHNTLKIAMIDPSDSEAVSTIEKYTGKVLEPVLASHSDIESSITKLIPWSIRDLFNNRTSTRIAGLLATAALILVIVLVQQYYNDKTREEYGNITRTDTATSYENHELILKFADNGKASLLGHGAYSSGYYSITFDSLDLLKQFIERKKDDFSGKQLSWLQWAMAEQQQPR